jgi:hypothetical protein
MLLTFFIASGEFVFALLFLLGPIVTLRRIARAHFSWSANALVLFGLPLFSYLLLRSKLSHQRGTVSWKGREYASEPSQPIPDHSARIARKLS